MKKKLCLITLTYNRPAYIERSFTSLYERAGTLFDHYVFDDCSNKETTELLLKLQKRYKFYFFQNEKNLGIRDNFMSAIEKVPKTYSYYVKMDSDIELLSDNFFSNLIEVFDYSDNVSCVTSRLEGIDIALYPGYPDFFAGHAIRVNQGIKYGCCLVFPREVFLSFEDLLKKDEIQRENKYGVDSDLYLIAQESGDAIVVLDVSMYHISNSYGQRRENPEYFTERSRWNIIDTDEVWYMIASKEVYPTFIPRSHMESLRRLLLHSQDQSLDSFLSLCRRFSKYDVSSVSESSILRNIDNSFGMKLKIKKKYLISNPENFRSTPYMERGSRILVDEIPAWAINNLAVVIEAVDVKEEVELDSDLNVKSGEIKASSLNDEDKIANALIASEQTETREVSKSAKKV